MKKKTKDDSRGVKISFENQEDGHLLNPRCYRLFKLCASFLSQEEVCLSLTFPEAVHIIIDNGSSNRH